MLKIFNTLSKEKQDFVPIEAQKAKMYSCGPTVYGYIHVGNHRTFILGDILKRVLKYNSYKVEHVMNITDVGHLTDDADSGEDKMEKGAKKEGKTVWEVAEYYTEIFKKDLEELNILEPSIWAKATDHIKEQIKQVEELKGKGFTYETSDGIYMDTTKVENYGALIDLDKQELKAGARVEMGEKRNPHDFALWKFSNKDEKRQMEWDAFGRKGFPGWHIECSAMAMKYLGDQFDIHLGGIDLSRVHHINEIAQAECSTGKSPWVNYWVHGEFLNMNDEKMARSVGNLVTVTTLKAEGLDPMAYRYLLLQSHYRKQTNFSIEALKAAQTALYKLKRHTNALPEDGPENPALEKSFLEAINDDLNMPEAIAVLWKGIKEGTISKELIIQFDKVLGLKLHELPPKDEEEVPEDIEKLLEERKVAREEKNWAESDRLRDLMLEMGWKVDDGKNGQSISKV